MELTWLGTAGFRISNGEHVFLVDPYLTRNPKAYPLQTVTPEDISKAEQLFISHGHFDHLYDVPAIASHTGSAVYCSTVAGDTLVRKGLDKSQVHVVDYDGFVADFGGYQAQAFFSKHVRFDWHLVIRTMARIHVSIFRYLPVLCSYPLGQVLSWRFSIGDRVIHHFGSAGSPQEELNRLAGHSTDVLLLPLQGNTRICDIALKYVRAMRPNLVIPHHQDDFYPPISSMVDIEPFVAGVKRECPGTEVKVMSLNETITM